MIDCRELYKQQPVCAVRLLQKGDAFKLGQICAPVFFLTPQNPLMQTERLRFGLYGSPDIGKSSFLNGVKSSLTGLFTTEVFERTNRFGKTIRQTAEHSENAGNLRFMDMGHGTRPPFVLPSYRKGPEEAASKMGTDFIEHAQSDFTPDRFHGALSMEWFSDGERGRHRIARLYAIPELLQSDAFQTSLAKIRQRYEEHVKPPPNPELEALFR